MVMSKAATVAGYLDELPADRKKIIGTLRRHVNAHLPKGYEEGMLWGMITWSVPLSYHPDTYNGQPLCYVALASQKQYCSLYLTGVYGEAPRAKRLADGFRAAGKRLDAGKSCIRFKTLDDLPLDVIGELIGEVSVDEYIAIHERAQAGRATKRSAKRAR